MKYVFKPPADKGREMERALPDLGVVTNTDVEAIVENSMTKWTNMLQLQIIKTVESRFEDALQAS